MPELQLRPGPRHVVWWAVAVLVAWNTIADALGISFLVTVLAQIPIGMAVAAFVPWVDPPLGWTLEMLSYWVRPKRAALLYDAAAVHSRRVLVLTFPADAALPPFLRPGIELRAETGPALTVRAVERARRRLLVVGTLSGGPPPRGGVRRRTSRDRVVARNFVPKGVG